MNAIEVASSLLSATTIVLVLSTGKELIGLAAVNFVFAIETGFAYMLVAIRIYPALRIRLELRSAALKSDFRVWYSLASAADFLQPDFLQRFIGNRCVFVD